MHTNTVEGVWSQLKYLSKDFSGITFSLLEQLETCGIKSEDYLNDFICYYLFLRYCRRKQMSNTQKENYLTSIIKI